MASPVQFASRTCLARRSSAVHEGARAGDRRSVLRLDVRWRLERLRPGLLQIARAGALDGYLLSSGGFYQTDYTRPLLFMGDGTYLLSLAQDQHVLGSQWGMMNETGSYPGQAWLWLYTLWYQIPPYSGNANADLMVVLTMAVLSAALVRFIPGIRDIPQWLPVHRLIWRDYYRGERGAQRARPTGGVTGPPVAPDP